MRLSALQTLAKGSLMMTVGEEQIALGPEPPEGAVPSPCPAPPDRLKKMFRKFDNMKLVFSRNSEGSKTTNNNSPTSELGFDFQENLKQNLLVEACEQLLLREEELFSQERVKVGEIGGVSKEKEQDLLEKDNVALLLHMQSAANATFSSSLDGERLKTLRSAVAAIMLQEEQDRRWDGLPKDNHSLPPMWRPNRCRLIHDGILKGLVDSRMRAAAEKGHTSSVDSLSTSGKREVCEMGMRLKEDMLTVARDVKDCYPDDFDVCNLYMRLYHQEFSARLTKLAHSGLDADDCSYILSWVNIYYPNDILKHKDLEGLVNCTSLGTLLPEMDVTRLEEQYFLSKESQVRMWMSTALKKEQKGWLSGQRSELIDGYFCCPLAIDVIQAVDGATRETRNILGSESKAQRILCQLDSFLIDFKIVLEEFIKGKRENTQEAMKAILFSIEQFRNFLVNDQTMPAEAKTSCMSTLAELEDCGYGYFTGAIHKELKAQYSKLWTQVWFTGGQRAMDGLMENLDKRMQQLTDLNPICMQMLLGRLHMEMTVEYVRRMMKRKIKLKDKDLEEAAVILLADSSALSDYFTSRGSNASWLNGVLVKLAEVVKLRDPGYILLEIATLAKDYPDISWSHISALLYIKVNLSKDDISNIKKSLQENRPAITSSSNKPPFFSKLVCVALQAPLRTFWRYPIFGRLEFSLRALPPTVRSDYSFGTVAVPLGLHFIATLLLIHTTLLLLWATSGVFMSLFCENGEYPDDSSDGWERAVAQLLEPVLGELSLQARSLQPQWRELFHVRARTLFQSFMSPPLRQTEDTKNLQSKIFLSY
ncbi:hypothetical protein DPEC_G00116190 [Dallia pectoralis]|uniref:Uncharacterized protein n=1 Tax=Dallia pectoralis TaxID=75939 RepID=A0ACC2GUC0_DALPE|nr:hypothetical protein DPEC_G00116190 [Dallia pectoralis]